MAVAVLVGDHRAEAEPQGVGENMNNAEKQFSQADRMKVAARIEQLEANTDAEVVCAVATESGRYDRAESICGLFFGILALISAKKIYALDDWDVATALPVGLQVLLVVAGFVAGSLLAGYWHGLRRLLVSQDEMESEVGKCVHQVFSQHGVGGTRHRGGLLIYVSLFEHRLEIHCDSALHGKLAPADLGAIRDAVLAQVSAGRLVAGLLAGLDEADKILSHALPHTGGILDALHNEVLVFHPRP